MSEVSDEDWELWRGYLSAHQQLTRELGRRLHRDAQVSHADFSVLLAVYEAPDHVLRPTELAELLAWEKSRVSHQLSRMEARGLVLRERSNTDGRGTVVGLTRNGQRTMLRAVRDHAAAIRALFFNNVLAQEKEVIAAVSSRIIEAATPRTAAV